MTDAPTATVRVADHAITGQDRIDGPVLLEALRAALDEHGAVRVSFHDVGYVTPSLVNEAMVPLLDDASIETLRTQIVIVDATRQIGDTVRRCMEHGVRWNAGEFAGLPLVEMEKDGDGTYRVVGDVHLPTGTGIEDPFARLADLDDAEFERMLDAELARPLDLGESLFDTMMRPTLRDRGITVIRCQDREDHDFGMLCRADLPAPGYDYRAENERWSRSRRRGRRG